MVIRIDFERVVAAWARHSPLSRAAIRDYYPNATYEAFERDELGEAEYFARLRHDLRFTGSDRQLVDGFNDLYLGLNDPVIEVLADYRSRGVLVVALTNTNRAHHAVWSRRYGAALKVFDAMHSSHELRARKPEPAAFLAVLDSHALTPEEAVFIDDVAAYVDAARALGIHGIRYSPTCDLRTELNALPWAAAV